MSNKRNWIPFEEARAFIQQRNFKKSSDWLDFIESGNLPHNIPKTPQSVYKNSGWNGLGDWLGTGIAQTQKREYLSFTSARRFARSLHLEKVGDWEKYCKSGVKPSFIPTSPEHSYRTQGWAGMSNWLGIKPRRKKNNDFLPFEQAREIVHKQRIKSIEAWYEWCKQGKNPDNIPVYPYGCYKNKGWAGWRDWLGPR